MTTSLMCPAWMTGATGSFQNSKLVGVMGPSGSGKSTFLNAVAGRASYGKIGGEVRVNGKVADMRQYRADIGFVPQVRGGLPPNLAKLCMEHASCLKLCHCAMNYLLSTAVLAPPLHVNEGYMEALLTVSEDANEALNRGWKSLPWFKTLCQAHLFVIHCWPWLSQDDIVYDDLTVRENLLYSAHLRLPPGTSKYKVRTVMCCPHQRHALQDLHTQCKIFIAG